jgi:hypothetical protein
MPDSNVDLGLATARSRCARAHRALDNLDRRIDARDDTVKGAAYATAQAEVVVSERLLAVCESD